MATANRGCSISFSIGKRDRKKLSLTVHISTKQGNFTGPCPIYFSEQDVISKEEKPCIILRHFVGIDDRIISEETEAVAAENEGLVINFTQGTCKFQLNHSLTRRGKSVKWNVKETRRVRMWLQLSFCMKGEILGVSQKEEIVFRNGQTKDEDAPLNSSPPSSARDSRDSQFSANAYGQPPHIMGNGADLAPISTKNEVNGGSAGGYMYRAHSDFPGLLASPAERDIFAANKELEAKFYGFSVDKVPPLYVKLRPALVHNFILKAFQNFPDENLEMAVNWLDRTIAMAPELISSIEILAEICFSLATDSKIPNEFAVNEIIAKVRQVILMNPLPQSGYPTARFFLKVLLQRFRADVYIALWANMFCDLALMNNVSLEFRPSVIATAAYCTALQQLFGLDISQQAPAIEDITGYNLQVLEPYMHHLQILYSLTEKNPPASVQLKYHPSNFVHKQSVPAQHQPPASYEVRGALPPPNNYQLYC